MAIICFSLSLQGKMVPKETEYGGVEFFWKKQQFHKIQTTSLPPLPSLSPHPAPPPYPTPEKQTSNETVDQTPKLDRIPCNIPLKPFSKSIKSKDQANPINPWNSQDDVGKPTKKKPIFT